MDGRADLVPGVVVDAQHDDLQICVIPSALNRSRHMDVLRVAYFKPVRTLSVYADPVDGLPREIVQRWFLHGLHFDGNRPGYRRVYFQVGEVRVRACFIRDVTAVHGHFRLMEVHAGRCRSCQCERISRPHPLRCIVKRHIRQLVGRIVPDTLHRRRCDDHCARHMLNVHRRRELVLRDGHCRSGNVGTAHRHGHACHVVFGIRHDRCRIGRFFQHSLVQVLVPAVHKVVRHTADAIVLHPHGTLCGQSAQFRPDHAASVLLGCDLSIRPDLHDAARDGVHSHLAVKGVCRHNAHQQGEAHALFQRHRRPVQDQLGHRAAFHLRLEIVFQRDGRVALLALPTVHPQEPFIIM